MPKIKLKKFLKYIISPLAIVALVAGYFLFLDKDAAKQAKADYLRFTETSTYFHVQSGTYGIRLMKTSSDGFLSLYDGSENQVATGGFQGGLALRASDENIYRFNFDVSRTSEIIENNKNRVVIHFKGRFNDTYGGIGNYLSDGTSDAVVDLYYYIYPDYFAVDTKLNTFDGIVLSSFSSFSSFLFYLMQLNGYFDSGETYQGTTTGESLAVGYQQNLSAQYGAVLATSTPDWQVVELSESHSGTSSKAFVLLTEATYQSVMIAYKGGELKGLTKSVYAVRPKIGTTAAERTAWAAKMIAQDVPTAAVGTITNDWRGEVFEPFGADGSYHLNAVGNKLKFNLHGETDAYALVSATTTGGESSLSFSSDSGLADGDGTATHWAQVGNRLPYGSFDMDDPDVLFYWDMDSGVSGQAPGKGIGPITTRSSQTMATSSGVSAAGIEVDINDYAVIGKANLPAEKGSVGFWYKFASSTISETVNLLIQHGDTWEDSSAFRLSVSNQESAVYLSISSVGSNFTNLDVNINDKNWHYFKLSWDAAADNRKLYIDGGLAGESSVAFDAPIWSDNFHLLECDGNFTNFLMDEFYISSDPDQPDSPSYYDVISYTDKNGSSLSGIPETGAGSMKWNHAPGSPILTTSKYEPAFTVHDYHPKSASSTGEFVDHLVLDLPLDGSGTNENAQKVYDKVSGTWIGTTLSGVEFVDAKQGNGASFDYPTSDRIELENMYDYIGSKGTIEFWYKDDGSSHSYDRFFSGGMNIFELVKNFNNIQFVIGASITSFSLDRDLWDDYWHHVRVSWNDSANMKSLYIDGVLQGATTTAFSMPNPVAVGNLTIGNVPDGSRYLGGIIDNFRIYNDIILPYGAYFTGANENGDYSKAHPDIVLWDDLESVTTGYAPKIGSGTVAVYNSPTLAAGVDGAADSAVLFNATTSYSLYDASNLGSENKFSFWAKPNWSDADTSFRLLLGRDFSNSIRLYKLTTPGRWDWSVRDSGGSYHDCRWDMSWNSGDWIHFETWYDINAESGEYNLGVKINGQDVVCTYSAATGPITITTWYNHALDLGGYDNNPDCIIDEFYITDSQDTPQIPTAFGKPLIAPQLSIESGGIAALKQVETDYDFAMLPDITSWLVRYKSDVLSETTFVISESLNTDSAEFDYNLDRNAPLLSTSYATGYSTITVQRGDGSWGDDFKLIFSEADAGVSSCYIGQGAAGSWGTNLCSATNMLAELSQNSVLQESQAGILNIVQSNAAEVIIRNDFVLPSEASTTETWHIFSDGSIVRDVEYTKLAANAESRAVNSSFTNYAYYPDTPSTSRGAGKYRDSFFMHLSRASTDLASDYQNPASFNIGYGGLTDDFADDHAADGFAEEYGAYAMNANYAADVADCFGSSCGTPVYHTIGDPAGIMNVTTSAVNAITADMWLVKFSNLPDLSGIHKRDRFLDGAATQLEWNIISVNDERDEIIVGNQEKNAGSPSALNTNQATVGPWYTSLFAWEAAEDRDLTATSRYANGEIEMAECWPTLNTSAVTVNDWTTGENNFIKIYTPISKRHKGKWTEDSYRLEYSATGLYQVALRIRDDYVRVDGLQIKAINNGFSDTSCFAIADGYVSAASDIRLSNNILTASTTTFTVGVYADDSDFNLKFYNNILYGFSGGTSNSTAIYADGSLVSIYNNTFICASTNCTGIRPTGGTVVAKNNLVKGFGNSNAYNGTFAAGTDYNATDGTDNIGVGTHNKTSQTFSFVDEAGKDFHLLDSDTGARSSGWNLSSDAAFSFSHDIDGQTRTERYGNWDIGADAVFAPSNKVKFEIAPYAIAYKPRFLINDWYPQSGKNGSEEGYIAAHLKAEGLTDTEYLYDEISGSSTKFKINNYANVEIADSVRGRGVRISDNDAASIEFDSSVVDKDGGTISFVYTPDSDTADDNKYFFNFIDTEGVSKFMAYRDNTDYVRFVYIGVSGSAASKSYDFKGGVPVNMKFTWKTDGDYARSCIIINNESPACYTAPKVTQLESDLIIGNYSQIGHWEIEGILDEIKIYSDAIYPYGAFYTGYEQNGDYLQADPSVLFYSDMENGENKLGTGLTQNGSPSKAIGVTGESESAMSIQNGQSLSFNYSSGIFDKDKGSISFWYKNDTACNTWSDQGRYIMYDFANGAMIYFTGSDTPVLRFRYNSSDLNTATLAWGASEWHHIRLTWQHDNTYLSREIWIDGILMASNYNQSIAKIDSIATQILFNYAETENFSIDGIIDELYITNNPRSQQIPTAFGKPIRIPLMRAGVSGEEPTRQRYGKDYITSFTADPNSVIIQYLKDTSGGIFEISEGAGTAQTVRLKGGVRLQGGVRF